MKNLVNTVLILCGVFSLRTYASDVQVDLTTPRGSLIKLDIYNPGLQSVLLLGPGQGCGPRLDTYDAIAAEAKGKGFTVVRLYWAYCVADAYFG